MSIVKKKKVSNKSLKKPGKVILTNDCTGKQVPGKIVITRGLMVETPSLVEIIPNYTKCSSCQIFLGDTETDLADVLNYSCIECFELQIEDGFTANSMMFIPITVISKNKRRKK